MTGGRMTSTSVADASVDRLLIILGDQLDVRSPVVRDLDKQRDAILMMEVRDEATHVPSHRQRIVLFLSAMRSFAKDLAKDGYRVHYIVLDDPKNTHCFADEIERALRRLKPARVEFIRPGAWRVLQSMQDRLGDLGIDHEMHEDPHFYLTPNEFSEWMGDRKEVILEHFYRFMRKELGVLVDRQGKPEGGEWNFDKQNREPFRGKIAIPDSPRFRASEITQEVISLVKEHFADAPGNLADFSWPVTYRQAERALDEFIEHRLPHFGTYQDAMVTGEPWMFHALLSSSLNLKLLDPRTCVEAAIEAYRRGHAPINAVEGFVRQLIGWREFIRGVYWHEGPEYGSRNALDQRGTLPGLYWTGETDMNCMKQCVGEVLDHGFGHHIQRLMVTGNFALISGVDPRAISDWYLAMYVDAVDWVTLPNTLGMAMHADGGVVGTKPYASSGRYVDRMSDYCKGCRYDPTKRTGDDACPFSTFYWDFLMRNERSFRDNRRMAFPMKNLKSIGKSERRQIRDRAAELRRELGID
jgi:deoxyribodipyrimidine photolyase-related protein